MFKAFFLIMMRFVGRGDAQVVGKNFSVVTNSLTSNCTKTHHKHWNILKQTMLCDCHWKAIIYSSKFFKEVQWTNCSKRQKTPIIQNRKNLFTYQTKIT